MNIIQSVIFLLVAITAAAQVIYQNQSPRSENAHEMEQRVLLEVKQHLHDFLDKYTDDFMTEISKTRDDILDLKSDLSDLILKHGQDIRELADSDTERYNALNSRITSALLDIDILKENNTLMMEKFSSQSSEAKQVYTTLSAEVQGLKNDGRSLQAEVTDDIRTLHRMITSAQSVTDILMGNYTLIIESISSLSSEAEKDRASNTALRTEVQDMKGKQQALKQLVDQVNRNTYAADILSLKSSVSDMKTDILGVRNDGIRLKSRVTNDVNTLNSRANAAQNGMDTLRKNVSSLFSEVGQAQASHARLSTDVQSVKGKQESLKQRVDQINTNKYTSDITGLKASVSDLQTEITGVKNDGNSIRTTLRRDYNTLNGKISSARSLATKTNNFAKGIGLACSWTSWQNSLKRSFTYRTRTGYIIRGVASYYCSYNEDRKFKFLECC